MLMEHGREKQGYKVLVVDDEDHIRRILKFQLEKHGYRVVLAENGEVALELMRRESPDLVILDLMMPKIDGLETCQRIRKNFQTSQIPIIMLTAKSELPDKIKGLQDGANDYLIKPYSSEELLLRVRNVLDWSFRQKEANPLTGLPGNRAIEKELQVRIEGKEPFAFLYLDIDNFKPYNDHYGYQKGDEAILFLSDIVTEAVNSLGGGSDFVGHIGGDDFVVITSPARGEFIGRHIIDQFDKGSLILFRDDDLQRGFMEIRNRLGEIKRMPLMSLTIALVVDEEGTLKHYAQVNDIASELKQYGKRMAGSVVVRERRKESASAQKVKS
jgi:CheY-like chemotaxis protein